ncbi:hypothetical protein TrST_g7385 [Triparma strigata]|uniref:S phase cyclin A-associated protein in the endoplasmic reticulum N-terminal domain-containing protein n=1 Tax=Triparma strigata TaxID=1606541 RepID=A0A9W7E919_9STRA|nr:hypothetical protein TrST_g7385 [Triparma strigata]
MSNSSPSLDFENKNISRFRIPASTSPKATANPSQTSDPNRGESDPNGNNVNNNNNNNNNNSYSRSSRRRRRANSTKTKPPTTNNSSTNTDNNNDADVEDSTICDSSVASHNSLFPHLLSRLSFAINELYYHCEATVEADQLGYVDRVKEVLLRGGQDFSQLHQRILVQNEHEEPTQVPKLHKGGLSWEVRKTNASKEQSSVIRSSIERMERDAKEQREAKAETDTDAESSAPVAPIPPEKILPSDNAWSKRLKFSPPEVENKAKGLNSTGSPFLKPAESPPSPPANDDTEDEEKAGSLSITGKSIVINTVYVDNNGNQITSPEGGTPRAPIPLSPNNDSEYPETDNETKDAIESVWKEAEQWVDNITMAEEAAWREIDLKSSRSLPPTPLSVNTNPEMLQSDVEQSPLNYNDDSSSATGLTPQAKKKKDSPQRNRNESWYSSSEDEDENEDSGAKIKPKPSVRTPQTSYNLTPLSMGSASSTASSSRFNTPSYATSHYSLHDKLSSPDRRRPSPAETEARLKERTEKAALRRKEREDAAKLKLAKAAERIEKARNSVELKSQEAAASLNEKMKQAEEQAERHRLSIVKKAESENMKVEEISFINALTEKDFEEQLSQKLLETNSRINAARERRRAAQQKKSSTNESRRVKSSKVMSKRELEREQQQQERWEKLQAKIKAVSERRAARMKELEDIKKAKEDKMEEAKKKRGELEDEVVKRSAEKEQRRFRADARRSSDFDESSPSKSDGERASLEALDELVTVQGPPSRPRQKTVSAEGDEDIFGSAGVPAPNQPANPTSMKLLSMLDVDSEKLSREEKKKRRKRLGSVRKKLREDMDLCEGVGGDGGEKISAAVSNLSAAVNALPQPADGISVDAASVQGLENEVLRLGKALSNEKETDGLKSAVAVLVQCYKAVSGLTGRLVFDRTLGVTVSVISRLVSEKKAAGIAILGVPDGPTAVIDGAVKCLCNEWIGTEEGREGSNGDAVMLVEVLLKAEAEEPFVAAAAARKADLIRYLVLTPLCEIMSCVLRSFKLPSSREGLITNVLLPLIETLGEGDGGEEGVVSLASFWRVEAERSDLKDLMLEKVGGGLISLVASVLPDTSNPNSSATNANGIPISVLSLRCLCRCAAMDVKRFQVLCRGEVASGWEGGGGFLEFNYVCGVVLSAPLNSGDIEECLRWCIVLMGYYVINNPVNQQRLHWGGDPLLGKLSSLPFQYFCDSKKKEILFPTLVLACFQNETNKKAVEEDLNPELLACFLRDKMSCIEQGDKVSEEWAKAVECSKRVPQELWRSAADFFT